MQTSRWMILAVGAAVAASTPAFAQRPGDRPDRGRDDEHRGPPPWAQMNRERQSQPPPAWGQGMQNRRPDFRSLMQNRPMLKEFAKRNPELAQRLRQRMMQGGMGRDGMAPWAGRSGRQGAPWMQQRGGPMPGMGGAPSTQFRGPQECPRCHFRFGPPPQAGGRPDAPAARPQAPHKPEARAPTATERRDGVRPEARKGGGCGDCDKAGGCAKAGGACEKAAKGAKDSPRDARDRAAPRREDERKRDDHSRRNRT